MNASLSDQLLTLGRTMTEVNQHQQASLEQVRQSLNAAAAIQVDMRQLHDVTNDVIAHFEQYIKELSAARSRDEGFERSSADLLTRLGKVSDQQLSALNRIRAGQEELARVTEQFTRQSSETTAAMKQSSNATTQELSGVADAMKQSAAELSAGCQNFTQSVVSGLSQSLGMFDASMQGLMAMMGETTDKLSGTDSAEATRQAAETQRLLTALKESIDAATAALRQKEGVSMARIRNRRAARTSNSGASWISYSDMMAALLLVFVLILSVSLYQYFTMLETKTAELDAQKALVSQQQVTLDAQTLQLASQQVTMDKQATEIAIIQVQLDSQAKELENAYIVLSDQQAQLQQAQTDLADREAKLIILQTDLKNKEMALQAANEVLENQQAAMAAQAEQIDALIGIRPRIITALSSALSSANLSATVDNSTGDIVLDSSVLFDTGKSEIRAEGKALLDRFVPVYLNVLLRDEYSAYLGEIIIEGYTDSTGDYYNNLKLSQDRALSVATYILKMPSLTTRQRDLLKSGLLTITGRGATGLIYDQYGNEDKEASRRVEFHFSLKDSEMIDQMNRLLQQTEGD